VSGFERLHPALQHHIVNSLGFADLRPLQAQALAPVLDGEHVLLVAPTAGGKTEAAFFPVLSRQLSEGWVGLSVLYVCPIRALLNNLELRLSRYAQLVGRRVALWHGDVGDAARRRIVAEPPDVLLTTPESLEVMLVSRRREKERLFAGVRAVIVDEIHAFAGDDRGWHLLSLLERIGRIAGRELQRLGLSATVGNPEALLDWLAGACAGPRRVVAPPDGAAEVPTDVQVDFAGSLANAATVVSRLHQGDKRLVFCDSRARCEELASLLRQAGVETHVSHSSLSAEARRQAEAAFAWGRDCVIVATSTLELGIDVGDLDRVVQIDAPWRVASFLQRLGRTGRRPGATRNCLFLATTEEALLQALGLVRLWGQGFVEPIEPPALPLHILAQQLMGLTLQERGIGRHLWPEWIGRMPGFATLDPADVAGVIDFMLARGILWDEQGLLAIGRGGEEAYGRRHFMELFSVFTSAPLFTVLHGRDELGQVHQSSFVVASGQEPVLLLAGRSWLVTQVDWAARVAHVQPTDLKGRSRWLGTGQPLHFALCQGIRGVLAADGPPAGASRRARERLDELRAELSWVRGEGTVLARETGARLKWWTFGGLLANAALARGFEELTGRKAVADNFALTLPADAGTDAVLDALRRLRERDPATLVPPIPDQALDELKFSDCLPPALARRTLEARVHRPGDIARLLAQPLRVVNSASG
jgi:ATP-dependent Lhr-like helicase